MVCSTAIANTTRYQIQTTTLTTVANPRPAERESEQRRPEEKQRGMGETGRGEQLLKVGAAVEHTGSQQIHREGENHPPEEIADDDPEEDEELTGQQCG